MTDTGIVRKIDNLGRVVIPMELRKLLGVGADDLLHVYTEGNRVILQKHENVCGVCGMPGDLVEINGGFICRDCINHIKHL